MTFPTPGYVVACHGKRSAKHQIVVLCCANQCFDKRCERRLCVGQEREGTGGAAAAGREADSHVHAAGSGHDCY